MSAPAYADFTFDATAAMSFTGFNGNDAYWLLYGEADWTEFVDATTAAASALGGLVGLGGLTGAAAGDALKEITDGYTLAGRYTWDNSSSAINDGDSRGICVSVSGVAIRCVTTEPSAFRTVFTSKSWYGDLSTATAPAENGDISSDYTQVTDSPTYTATEGMFACETSTSGDDATSTCFLMQENNDDSSNSNYRFDMQSGDDGTINFWTVSQDQLSAAITVSDWKSAVSGVAAATGAVALALLSF